MVFIVVQNFVGIGFVVLKICEFFFSVMRVWLDNAYSRPFLWYFRGKMKEQKIFAVFPSRNATTRD